MNTPFIYTELKNSALLFVAQNQSKQGGFRSLTTAENKKEVIRSTIFYPVLINSLITSIPKNERVQEITSNIINFLQTEKTKSINYQYWSRQDKNYCEQLYPYDLNDIILSFLARNYGATTAEDLASLTLLLTHQEQKPGGPYYTWINDHEAPWNDIDPVVNSAIHFVLQKFEVKLETLESYILECLENDRWQSPYYASPWLNLYLISRSLSPEKQVVIFEIVNNLSRNLTPQNALEQACKILITNDYHPSTLAKFTETSFFAYPAINEITVPNKKEISGCDALTAALWALVWHNAENVNMVIVKNNQNHNHEFIRDSATKIVAHKISTLGPDLRERGVLTLAELISKPISREIILLSADIGFSITNQVTPQLYATLGAANIFGWLAFSIYDDCYDEGKISPDLSLANICLRSSARYYEEAAKTLKVNTQLVFSVLDMIDEAHAEELTDTLEFRSVLAKTKQWAGITVHQIAERSFGHCLGPIIISQSMDEDKERQVSVKKLLNHYLTARQICDDLHDWPIDFSAKRITSVTKSLFMASYAFPNTNQFQAKKIFWNEGIDLVIKKAKQELYEARQLLKKIHWPLCSPELLSGSIEQLEKSLDKATVERLTIKSLIHHFKNYEQVHNLQPGTKKVHSK